jgi:hypothetical protein
MACRICQQLQRQYERAILRGDQNAADFHAATLEKHQQFLCEETKVQFAGIWPGGQPVYYKKGGSNVKG